MNEFHRGNQTRSDAKRHELSIDTPANDTKTKRQNPSQKWLIKLIKGDGKKSVLMVKVAIK
jgi:hypothetical protein